MSQLKRQFFEELLGQERSVFVYLDPRRLDVAVPVQFKKDPVLVLQIGLNLPVHIPLSVEDDRFVATLSFSRSSFKCEVPWPVVFAIVGESDNQGRVFESDVPAEIRAVQLKGFGNDDGVVVAPISRATTPAFSPEETPTRRLRLVR